MKVVTQDIRQAGLAANLAHFFLSSCSSVFVLLILSALSAAPAESQVRIHAGGVALTDSSGNFWNADAAYQGGSTFSSSHSIANTPDQALYQTERYGNMQYSISVPNGTYTVTLKFAELYHNAARSRVFNVAVNSQQVLSNFDIFAAAGGQFIAVDQTFQVTVTGGVINIAFSGVIDNAKVDAIQILPQGTTTPTTPTTPTSPTAATARINAGGGAYTDASGNVWGADAAYQGGGTYATSHSIGNTSDASLYQTERWGNMQYSISVANGTYAVTLKFAELYFNAVHSRVFNVAINGQQVLSNFDIFAAAGGQFIAVDQTFQVTVTGGAINIAFSGVIDNAKVDAIQIVSTGPTTPTTPTTPTSPTSAWVRIHAGGGAYTDSSGNVWGADAYSYSGATFTSSHSIGNTPDQALYQTERYGNIQYLIPGVPNGTFNVTLKFAELYHDRPGVRTFNVVANNQTVLSNFDIFAAAGGQFLAVDRTFQVTVTNGTINLTFNSVIDNPKVAAIQVVQLTSGPGLPATSANTFLSSLGVNTHFAQGYNATNYVAPIQYLGVRNIRDGDLNLANASMLHQQTGVLTDVLVGCADFSGTTNSLPSIVQYLASTGSLLSLEGTNEPNNWPVVYNGQQGGGNGSWLPVAQCQRDFYSAVKSNSALSSYPVLTVSQGGGETDNVGLQFLTIPSGAGTVLPAGTKFADYANVHNYVSSNNGNLYIDNQAWLAADTTSSGFPGDTLYSEFGVTWARGYVGYSPSQLQTLPRITTETGWDSVSNPGGEPLQGKMLVNTYLDQFARGWKYTFIYQLVDGEGGASSQGLFHTNYTAKLAATYIHNLTTILADAAPLASPGLVNYSIQNLPATVHVLLLQKSGGTFELVVWNERATGSDTINLNLGASFSTVKVYDITAGTGPVQTLTNVSLVPLTLSDHAVILEFK